MEALLQRAKSGDFATSDVDLFNTAIRNGPFRYAPPCMHCPAHAFVIFCFLPLRAKMCAHAVALETRLMQRQAAAVEHLHCSGSR
ncbi:hypothetical protein EON66_03820 [archaeon]|nr:MAG: hypothetical protein EON66_03820 [archaeon]